MILEGDGAPPLTGKELDLVSGILGLVIPRVVVSRRGEVVFITLVVAT